MILLHHSGGGKTIHCAYLNRLDFFIMFALLTIAAICQLDLRSYCMFILKFLMLVLVRVCYLCSTMVLFVAENNADVWSDSDNIALLVQLPCCTMSQMRTVPVTLNHSIV